MAEENPIATEVIYEDDDVRVWRQLIKAGETLERHTHQHDYVLVTVAGEGPLAVDFHEGSGGKLGDHISFSSKRGDADFVPKGHIETAHNQGEQDYRAILVEFKK